MPELAGQIRSGRPLSERECFVEAIGHLKGLRDCLRGLALLRMDQRWLLPVRLTEHLEDAVTRMMNRAGKPPLLIPRDWERH